MVVAAMKYKSFRDNCEVAIRLLEFITQHVLQEASTSLLKLLMLVLVLLLRKKNLELCVDLNRFCGAHRHKW
jgi:hypothetical protein